MQNIKKNTPKNFVFLYPIGSICLHVFDFYVFFMYWQIFIYIYIYIFILEYHTLIQIVYLHIPTMFEYVDIF